MSTCRGYLPPYIRTITTDEPTGASERRARRLANVEQTARYCQVHQRTVENWLEKRYVGTYRRAGSKELLIDLDELESAFIRLGRSKMRDGRKGVGNVVPTVIIEASA